MESIPWELVRIRSFESIWKGGLINALESCGGFDPLLVWGRRGFMEKIAVRDDQLISPYLVYQKCQGLMQLPRPPARGIIQAFSRLRARWI